MSAKAGPPIRAQTEEEPQLIASSYHPSLCKRPIKHLLDQYFLPKSNLQRPSNMQASLRSKEWSQQPQPRSARKGPHELLDQIIKNSAADQHSVEEGVPSGIGSLHFFFCRGRAACHSARCQRVRRLQVG